MLVVGKLYIVYMYKTGQDVPENKIINWKPDCDIMMKYYESLSVKESFQKYEPFTNKTSLNIQNSGWMNFSRPRNQNVEIPDISRFSMTVNIQLRIQTWGRWTERDEDRIYRRGRHSLLNDWDKMFSQWPTWI